MSLNKIWLVLFKKYIQKRKLNPINYFVFFSFAATDSSGLSYVQSEKSKFYQLKLDQIFQSSNLSNSYLFNEILLLEGLEDQKSLKVHFNIHMSLKDQNVTEEDVSQILRYHIISRNSNNSFLAEIDIDPRSLLIKGK